MISATGGQFRLLLLADPYSWVSLTLLSAALHAAAARPDVEVVGVVDSARRPPRRWRLPRGLAARAVRRGFNPRQTAHGVDHGPLVASCGTLARLHRVPLLAPRAIGLNDPAFVAEVRELRPDAALALMVPTIFGEPLLQACRAPVNYHNGLLPGYRGVASTEWSIYEGVDRSGFTFHRMTVGIDEGPVLMQDSVAVAPGATPVGVERAKTKLAVARMSEAIGLLVAGDPGVAQQGAGRRHTRAETAAITAVGDPRSQRWSELQQRIGAFGQIDLDIAGKRWAVTELGRVEGRRGARALAFRTSDGVLARPVRCRHLPPLLYSGYRSLRVLSGRATARPASQQAQA
jgi:methionyl-tRNA formyltransferase